MRTMLKNAVARWKARHELNRIMIHLEHKAENRDFMRLLDEHRQARAQNGRG